MQRFDIHHIYNALLSVAVGAVVAACSPGVPTDFKESKVAVDIWPDYQDVTIPVNIAPMNFEIKTAGDSYVAHIHSRNGEGFTIGGSPVDMDIDSWKTVMAEAKGDSVFIDIYVENGGQWEKHPAVRMAVAEEIDPYITYRLIEPSFVNFEMMNISQRCLEDFTETEIYDNQPFAGDASGSCVNCHHSRNYNRDGEWQFHVRLENGGTLIANGKQLTKVNLKLPETISAGVYPAWHPTLPVIVYSNNKTDQIFHTIDRNKIEVQDNASDLIMYDTETAQIDIVANDSTEWETFPAWTPDGRWLYYVSATIPAEVLPRIDAWRHQHYKEIKYNIYRKPFDPETRRFGASEMVYNAAENNASATLPRISPDGKWLLFTQGEYGTFHIWHHDADLWIIDLAEDVEMSSPRNLDTINSDDTESYHSWSSNGRWIMFSSRRDDGSYTRLYFSYFDEQGRAHKPFILPQRTPQHNIQRFKSYNVPEFIVNPVEIDRNAIIKTLEKPAQNATLRKQD